MTQDLLNYIDGSSLPAVGDGWIDSVEPATGTVYGRLPDSGADDVERAVDAATRAAPMWSQASVRERSLWLHRLADEVESRLDAFARAESVDNGKPITLARTVDIPRAVTNLRFFADLIRYDRLDAYQTSGSIMNVVQRQPLGVVGCISPWNLPLYLFTWKIAPALATGNAVIGKPSELTPATAAMLGECCQAIDFPSGVLNIVHGHGARAGDAIVRHPSVSAISFTGGTETGRVIAGIAAPMFKKLSLELGGKNPNIIFEDADLDHAVPTSVAAAFTNQGQICLCGSRILVQRDIAASFTDRFIDATRGLRIGDPLDPETQFGALVSRDHLDKVIACLRRARDEGAACMLGGGAPMNLPARCAHGFFLEPTVLTDLDQSTLTNQEEIFGPVVTIDTFDDPADAIRKANATPYGLAAMVWTRDGARMHRVASRLQSGIVWGNCWMKRDLRTPFGGMKASGLGREGGDDALRFFTESRTVCIDHGKATADEEGPST